MNYLENVIQKINSLFEDLNSFQKRLSNYCTKGQSNFKGKKVQYMAQRVDGKKVPVDRKLYSDVVKMPTKESCSKGGKLGGNKHSELRNSKCSELGKRTWKENFKDNISKRRCYRGNNNPFSKITEKKAQQILDDYTKLVNNGHKTYGLYPAVYKLHQDTTLKTVKNICRRSCWKHLKPN